MSAFDPMQTSEPIHPMSAFDPQQTSVTGIRGIGIYGIVASGGEPCGTPDALYSNPFAFRTVWAAGEERNVTSALAASV